MQMMFKERLSCSGSRHAKGMQNYVHPSSREKIARRSHRVSTVIDLMAKALLDALKISLNKSRLPYAKAMI